jgi:hypothetical protein
MNATPRGRLLAPVHCPSFPDRAWDTRPYVRTR